MPKSEQPGSGASRIGGSYWQRKNYSLARCTVGTELLCHLSSIRRMLSAEAQEKNQAARMLLKDCPKNGACKAQSQRQGASPVLGTPIDHLAVQPPDHISGALLSCTFRRTNHFRAGVAEKERSCPCHRLCYSRLNSVCFETWDKVNPQRWWSRPCLHPSSTVKGNHQQRKGTCGQMQDASTACSIQRAGTHISCSNTRRRALRLPV